MSSIEMVIDYTTSRDVLKIDEKGVKNLDALLQFNVIFFIVPCEQKAALNTSRIFPRGSHFVNTQ